MKIDFSKRLIPKRGRGARQGRLFAVGVQKSVDESFLDDLDTYRAELAKVFKNKNAELDGEDLTEAVTRTIDRLVFIRFLEDKLIEPETMMDKFDSWADFVRAAGCIENADGSFTLSIGQRREILRNNVYGVILSKKGKYF